MKNFFGSIFDHKNSLIELIVQLMGEITVVSSIKNSIVRAFWCYRLKFLLRKIIQLIFYDREKTTMLLKQFANLMLSCGRSISVCVRIRNDKSV